MHAHAGSCQSQSPLFRIPKELRDQIYREYVFEEDGYFHDFGTGKLHRSGHRTISLSLMYTCVAIGRELEGVALRTNKVTFTTGDCEAEGHLEGLQSKAGRFKVLLDRAMITKRQMLLLAKECISPLMLEEVVEKFEEDGQYLVDAFVAVIEGPARPPFRPDNDNTIWNNGAHLFGAWYNNEDGDLPVRVRSALQQLLRLASTHPDFENLAKRAFDSTFGALRDWNTFFDKEAYTKVLDWFPSPWMIPSESELAFFEQHLVGPATDYLSRRYLVRDTMTPFKWRFSAAAVAIDFLHRYPQQRVNVRCIILNENLKSVANPEDHVRGLIPFLNENTLLSVERQVGFWSNILPQGWDSIRAWAIDLDEEPLDTLFSDRESIALVTQFLQPLIPWIQEATRLPRPLSYSLALEGSSSHTLEIWEAIKHGIVLHEAHLLYHRNRGIKPPLPAASVNFQVIPYPQPCHLPDDFPGVIRRIIEGSEPLIKFDGFPGMMVDAEEALHVRRNWSPADWSKDWVTFLHQEIRLPEPRSSSMSRRYRFPARS